MHHRLPFHLPLYNVRDRPTRPGPYDTPQSTLRGTTTAVPSLPQRAPVLFQPLRLVQRSLGAPYNRFGCQGFIGLHMSHAGAEPDFATGKFHGENSLVELFGQFRPLLFVHLRQYPRELIQ